MYEPNLSDIVPGAAHIPPLIETAEITQGTGLADARSVTVVYAPASITHHHAAPASAPAAPVTPPTHSMPAAATAAAPMRRPFTRAELSFHVGMAITASGVATVALSIAAGDPSWLLAGPPVVGCATVLGSAMAINREESHRSVP